MILKNISYLSLAQAIKIILRFVAFSYLTKTLTTLQYGQFLTIIGFCEFFQIFTLPGLSKPLARSALKNLKKINFILSDKSGIRNLLAFIAILMVNFSVSFMSYDDSVISLIRFYSVVLFFDSLRTYIRIVFNCFEEFKWISLSEVIQAASYLVLIIFSISNNLGVKGVIFSSALSSLFSLISDYFNSRKYSKFKLFGGLNLDKAFVASALIFTLTNVMWILITKVDILMISVISSSEDVAIFGVANRIIFFGLMGISIISKVLFPPLVKGLEAGHLKIKKYYYKIVSTYVFIIISCTILGFFSQVIIKMIAGEKYIASAGIFNILMLYLIIQAFSTPIKLILYALEKEKIIFFTILPLPIVKVVFNVFLFNTFGLYGIAYSTVLVYLIYLISLIFVNRKILHNLLT